MNGPKLFLAALLASGPTLPAKADIVDLDAAKDNTLYQTVDGATSNGAGDYFFAGRTEQGAGEDFRRGLLAFDIGSIVPAGSTINSVVLTLYMSRTKANDRAVSLHRLFSSWGEGASDASGEEGSGATAESGDATWLHTFYDTAFWSTPGGDFSATASASAIIPKQEGFYSWFSATMTQDVQEWLDDPAGNFGWGLIGDETETRTSKRFNSRQHSDASRRPFLTIDFTPPAEPVGSCCMPDDSCVVLTQADCESMAGVYQGDGTDCISNPCVVITGACCFDDGTCLEQTASDCAAQAGEYQGDGTDCLTVSCPVVLEPFVDPLLVPAVAQPTTGDIGGAAFYDIEMTEFQQQLHRDLAPTTVWGYEGSYPGPTIEASRDLPVFVRWINELKDEFGNPRAEHYLPVDLCMHGPNTEGSTPRTVVHLHGGHVPPEADGYPEDTFLPGESVTYLYENRQLPATLWYHDHALGITRLNVYMGLAGFYLLRDEIEQSLGLPSGEFEIPLAIQDRSFHSDGTLRYPVDWQDQHFGDTMLVNGKVWPFLDVNKGSYRFRLLNGCNSRTLTLSLSPAAPWVQIGTDGGLLPAPVPLTDVTLAPGERADVVIDFGDFATGAEVLLQNSAPAPFPGEPGVGVIPDVMKFVVRGMPGHTEPVPAVLAPRARIPEALAVEFREFVLRRESEPCAGSTWLINGLGWDDITEFPTLDSIEVWSFANRSSVMHPMHMHLVQFHVLDRQEFEVVGDEIVPFGPRIRPAANEAGWKDTVRVDPFWIVRVIARFSDYEGLFPYHCHILEHEDHEMMRQFKVVPKNRHTYK